MKVLVIDVSRCNGCYNCQIACKDEHCGNDWTPYAKPQPNVGQFWMKQVEEERGSAPKVRVTYTPTPCMHCDEPPCIPACPIEGAIYKRDDGIVIIDPEKCNGCGDCVNACPYDTIYLNEDLNVAQKCTMCAHLLDRGWKEPRCVDACPTGALRFGEESEFKDLLSKSEVLHPEFKAKPRVHYIGLPGRFVAGAVYDPDEDKCLEGATAVLTDVKGGKKFTVKTDNFGDFWFENMEGDKTFSLKIEKEGYVSAEIKDICTEKDVNVGDIELRKVI